MRDARTGRDAVAGRDSLAERHRELALRHEVLGREHPGSGRYDDLLERVFDATDDLMRVVEEAEAQALRRRRLLATGLLTAAVTAVALVAAGILPAVALVAAGILPAVALVAAAIALAAAAALWLTAFPGRGAVPGRRLRSGTGDAGVPRQRPAGDGRREATDEAGAQAR